MAYNIFSKTGGFNNDNVVGIMLVVILLAVLVNVKPNYFKYLFKTLLGNLILSFAIIVIGIFDVKWGIGFAAIAFIIYQAFHISCVEGFSSKCKPGCIASNKPSGNCKISSDKKSLSCPWECSTHPEDYNNINCTYASECSTCGGNTIYDLTLANTDNTDDTDNTDNTDDTDNTDNTTNKKYNYKTKSSTKTISKPVTGITDSNGGSWWGLFQEGYPIPKSSIWPKNVIAEFIKFQKFHNPNLRFDLDIIQKQATLDEVQTLFKTGKWPWSPDVINLYKEAISQNNIINNEPGSALNTAQTVYNQTAIIELLSWNTKEGSFLLNGTIIKHTDGMPDNLNNIVRCAKDRSTGKISMQKVVYTGYNGVNGSLVSKVSPINNSDIPKEVNGFKFLKSECNPCSAISDPADYSCPFSLNVGNGNEVSAVWQQLWGLNSLGDSTPGAKKTDKLDPAVVDSKNDFNKEDFPILSQLRDELMKGISYINVSFEKPEEDANNIASSSGENIGNISGSIVPEIITNDSNDNKIYYGTKNTF
jgi:hypothetical protein